MTKELKGRVAAVLPENIDTDIIYPGRYLFELAYPEIRDRIQAGDILVAGKNFGCGSSREQAAAAVKYAGVGAVIAVSFARIFYRNAINLGLPAIVAQVEADEGDELAIDLEEGQIVNVTKDLTFQAAPLDPRAVELLEAGGLIPYLKRKVAGAKVA